MKTRKLRCYTVRCISRNMNGQEILVTMASTAANLADAIFQAGAYAEKQFNEPRFHSASVPCGHRTYTRRDVFTVCCSPVI